MDRALRICKRGHEVSGTNRLKDGACRVCKLESMRAWHRANRPASGVRTKRKACPNGHEYADGSYKENVRGRVCLICRKGRLSRYNNKPETVERHKAWYRSNVERVSERGKKYRSERIEELRARARNYAKLHKDEVKARHKRWRSTEKGKERCKVYALNFRRSERGKLFSFMQHQKRKGAGPVTKTEIRYIAILKKDPCCYCGAPMEEIDHIRPISGGGTNSWDNLTASCTSCNRKKNAMSLLEFMLRRASA